MSHTAANRILVISSTQQQARGFVQRIKDLSDSFAGIKPSNTPLSSSSDVGHDASDSKGNEVALSDDSESIPWTIVNRYYAADVHFELRVLREIKGHHIDGVPAVVYVFNGTEKYRDHVSDLARTIAPHSDNIEVSLAVRFTEESSPKDSALGTSDTANDEDGVDEFLSGHNFEYIDGDRRGRKPTGDGGGYDDEDPSGVPGLPRVIDALSTIMWPSLVQSEATRNRKSRARELLDWAREEEEDDGLKALVSPPYDHDDHMQSSSSQSIAQLSSHKKSRMQREMDELQKWLEEEEHTASSRRQESDDNAWKHADWTDMPTTPTIRTSYGQEDFGFEDDFTDFIGAPMEVEYGGKPVADRLIPMPTGASYHSLASFDEHPFSSPHAIAEDDGDDLGLPSQAEIEETSRKIFGHNSTSATLQVPSQPQFSRNLDSPALFPISLASPSIRAHDIPFDTPDSSFAPDDDEEFEDFEMGAFDLSRVLSALQGMKEEISGMENEGERRKAAARVALGLVYGLKKEEERTNNRTDDDA